MKTFLTKVVDLWDTGCVGRRRGERGGGGGKGLILNGASVPGGGGFLRMKVDREEERTDNRSRSCNSCTHL